MIFSFGPVHIRKGSKKLIALDNIEIPAGLTYLAGRNGVGKSSLPIDLQSQNGQMLDKNGTVLGVAKTCLLPQRGGLIPHLSAARNIDFARNLTVMVGDTGSYGTAELLGLLGIGASSNVKAKNLSGGQQRALALGVCLVQNPDLIFLDEPTAGLDYEQKTHIAELIFQTAGTKSLVLASHDWQLFRSRVDALILLPGNAGLENLSDLQEIIDDPIVRA